ncbi:hypothetical protein [Macrococcoides caseolyticum]|uniref:Uncharacterized protein n=1 Tax=Macrococcoides caseolyticum TaxID=69966 RepID=A0A855GGQ9_9STAP|nr:hypothetical protein [Macrococcus caseolyticus]PKE26521.1 hypothetical protein CW686_04385 [Macrococcus caseolyticus]PKE59149.1 hypothetical protein CW673_03995 [Macrococcus caseolyticus]PKE69571.1 hypothetical protein CW662_08290 [Macrococcus caseolyticus]
MENLNTSQVELLTAIISEAKKMKPGDRFTYYRLVDQVEEKIENFNDIWSSDDVCTVQQSFEKFALDAKTLSLRHLEGLYSNSSYIYEVIDINKNSKQLKNFYASNKQLEVEAYSSGAQNVSIRFDFYLDKEGAVMLEDMLEAVHQVPEGEIFDESSIWDYIPGRFNEEVYEPNFESLLNIFNLYCTFFNYPYSERGMQGGEYLPLYRSHSKSK